jgi:hypothetical protein
MENYYVRFGIDLQQAKQVEVHFSRRSGENNQESARYVVRLSQEEVKLGRKLSQDGAFEPLSSGLGNSRKNISSDQAIPVYDQLSIELHEAHWLVVFDNQSVGWIAASEEPFENEIQLHAEGGNAHFADLVIGQLQSGLPE